MKLLYLDYNLYVYLMDKNPQLISHINNLKQDAYQLIYSPAHIEEVAVPMMRDKRPIEEAFEKLEFISSLTDNHELLPYKRDDTQIIKKMGTFLCRESPKKCYLRVVSNYKNNDIAENLEQEFLEKVTDQNLYNNEPSIFNNTKHNQVLKKYYEEIMIGFNKVLWDYYKKRHPFSNKTLSFADIKHDFQKVECMINLLFNWVEALRFFPEPVKKYRSRMHDVSHAIYASYSSEILTSDRKFANKLKVVYDFLSIKTKITYVHPDKERHFVFSTL